MSALNLNDVSQFNSSAVMNKEEASLPDLYFYKWCDEKYGINRGVYNTLDELFYEEGYTNVYARRSLIIQFLNYSLTKELYDKKLQLIKFGRGRLKNKLIEFLNELNHKERWQSSNKKGDFQQIKTE